MTLAELADVAEVERLTLRPGDALIVKTQHWLSEEEYARLAENMKAAFPGTKIVIMERGMDVAVLRAEDTPTTKPCDCGELTCQCGCQEGEQPEHWIHSHSCNTQKR